MQDHRKLKAFVLADELVAEVYRRTRAFPADEQFGLRSQIRRAAVSAPTNIVEGCARRTQKELANFLAIALGSASEVRYLIEVAQRIEMLPLSDREYLEPRYDEVVRVLSTLLRAVEAEAD